MANRLKEDEKNERIIRNLLKLPENRRCINCNSLGPQYVCTNFSTFVCTTCSGIHREFTHRVKSVSMAKFTPLEVSALQGGGNASAREIYLKEWDPQRNSLPDLSNIERLRDFVKHVYVDRRYTGERSSDKPLRTKGETEDFIGNRRVDINQGGSRGSSYDENSDRPDRPSLGGRSPGYDQDSRQYSDYRKSPVRAEVVNDWRREDRFGNGRRSEDRNSDGVTKFESRSPDSQSSDMSSPPMVRPVRDILGDSVSPLRVIEPPKATAGKSANVSDHTQRSASSSSLASYEGNPPVVKVEMEASFIDFDSVPEPTVAMKNPQETSKVASAVQLTTGGDNWANFDSVPVVKAQAPVSNPMESLLSELSVSTYGAPASLENSPPIHSSGSEGSSLGSTFGSVTPSMVFPSGGALPPSLPAQKLTSVDGKLTVNAPTGEQRPIPNLHQNAMYSRVSGPQVPPPLAPSNESWNPLSGPVSIGPHGATINHAGQAITDPAKDTSFGLSSEYSVDAKSSGRKELPADLFTMTNSYPMPPVSGWYSGFPYAAGPPVHYNISMSVPNYHQVPRSTNPFDFANERAPVQAPSFPSMASLHGSLPMGPSASGLLRTSSVGTPSSLPLPAVTQPPFYASPGPPAAFIGQELTGSVPQRPMGPSGFASLNPNHQTRARSATSTTGNPFG